MMDDIQIRQATSTDVPAVVAILNEAAQWLEQQGMPLWRTGELEPERIAAEVGAGLFFLVECAGEAAGTVKFQLEDPVMWPDAEPGSAAYIHRLAVRRAYAGRGLAEAVMQWAVDRTRELGLPCLRLDTEASRTRLRAVYERFGFRYHSEMQSGPYLVARYEYSL